jgi:L-amino acid N-acyltransferase YncA
MGHLIRLATEDDAAAMAAIYAPYVRDTAISFEIEPPDAAAFEKKLGDVMKLAPWLVWDEGGEVLGYAYASSFRARPAYRFTVETSIYVRSDTRGRGVGRALYAELLRRLAAQGFKRAIGGMTLPNPESARLHQSLGFERVGAFHAVGYKFGKWHDVEFWERQLAPFEGTPAETRPVER